MIFPQIEGWLRMSTEELASIGETSVDFKNGGHLVGMDVFHQLHCLNYLRKKMDGYKEAYPDIAEDEQIPPRFHIGKSLSHGTVTIHITRCIWFRPEFQDN